MNKERLVFDVECYINYFLIMFKKLSSGEIIYFEKFNGSPLDRRSLLHIINKYCIVSFNGIKYDQLIIEAAIAGFTNESFKAITADIIPDEEAKKQGVKTMQPWEIRKKYGFPKLQLDHIDLIEVAPLKASLKIYGGRMHSPLMQDLPIHHIATIMESDLPLMRKYCGNDLAVTADLLNTVTPELTLRINMGNDYGIDIRSKSDAQIAEQVIRQELKDKYDIAAKKTKIPSGTKFRYKPPGNLKFQTPVMIDAYDQYLTRPFVLQSSGHVEFEFRLEESDRNKKGKMPESKKKLKVNIGDTVYTIGMGGLHSTEKKSSHVKGRYKIKEYDVAAFYPRIILNNKLFPKHLGKHFLDIYEDIVNRRLKAKSEAKRLKGLGNLTEAKIQATINESLKITINGLFGKFGSKYSIVYAPDLLLQVTVTGQLSLIMLIERLELAGISVVSGNTDGIVVKVLPEQEDIADEIVEDWEFDTDYEMEMTEYVGLHSRDVNNYIAIKPDGSIKGKGAYADQSEHYYKLRKNPVNAICVEAVKMLLRDKTPIEDTIRKCKDITKFITVRTVNGGAIHDGVLLGKAIRWYYSSTDLDAIYYSTNGNKVPRSDGATPIMNLPNKFPIDVDYNWYIEEALDILNKIGFKKK